MFSQSARFGDIEVSAPPGYRNFFLVKYDASGKAVWGKSGAYDGAGAHDYNTGITGLAASPDGGVVAVGYGLAPATIDGQFVDTDSNPNIAAACPECAMYGQLKWFAFLVKYDANGTRLWFHTIYSYSIDSHLAIDALGNILLVEHLAGVADIDGQPIHVGFSSPSALDYNGPEYLLHFDSAGQFQGLKTIMTPGDPNELIDQIGGVDVDAEGNLYVTGHFIAQGGLGIVTYTLNVGSVSLSVTDPNDLGTNFYFTAKLDATGAGLWVKPVGCQGVKVDGAGNVYVAQLDEGTGAVSLVKLDPFGREAWTISGVGGGLACDKDGNVVTGGPSDLIDFQNLTGQTVSDSFGSGLGSSWVAFNPAGQIRWAKYFPEPNVGGETSVGEEGPIVQDSPGSWFLAGAFEVVGELDGINLQTPWPGYGSQQDFVARLAIPATNDPPVLTIVPQDTTVFETRPLQLQVAAASLSPLSYQWLFNGRPVSISAGNALTFTNATLDLSGQYSVSVSNANGGVEAGPVTLTVLPLTKLAEALNATNLQWRLGGQRSWQLDTNVTHDGLLALRTDNLLYGTTPIQDCWIETTLDGPGVLSFWWKASTTLHNPFCGCDDGFQFLLDGIQQFEIQGDVDWQSQSLPIDSGSHTARWYWSEPSPPDNLNLCWVDQATFQLPASGAPIIRDPKRLADGEL